MVSDAHEFIEIGKRIDAERWRSATIARERERDCQKQRSKERDEARWTMMTGQWPRSTGHARERWRETER